MTTATTFSRQNDIGSRMSNTQYWENLVLVVVLVSESKALYHRIRKPPLSSVQTKRWRWHSDETSRPFQSHHLVSLSPQSQFLRGLLIFFVIRSSWKHFSFLFIYSALSGLEHCDCLWLPPQTHTKFLARRITSSWRYDVARIIFASFFISLP